MISQDSTYDYAYNLYKTNYETELKEYYNPTSVSASTGTKPTKTPPSWNLPRKDLQIDSISTTYKISAPSYLSTSDYRIKENIQPLDASYTIDKVNPVTYTNTLTNRQDIGVIAHELQEVFPYLVSGEKDGDEKQSVNYNGLIGILVKEIQDLKSRVAILESIEKNT